LLRKILQALFANLSRKISPQNSFFSSFSDTGIITQFPNRTTLFTSNI